jgi:hypothetical protein
MKPQKQYFERITNSPNSERKSQGKGIEITGFLQFQTTQIKQNLR